MYQLEAEYTRLVREDVDSNVAFEMVYGKTE